MSVPIVVGVVTFNNLPMLERCFDSWRRIPDSHLVIWDNGSDKEIVDWLKSKPIDRLFSQSENAGLCVARNRIIEYNRNIVKHPYILLMDSDVLFHEGSLELMVSAMDADPEVGLVSFSQANQGVYPVSPDGYVEETSNECQLTRMRMWREIGLFPESLTYYSGDSWKSSIANMHGWRTKMVLGAKGYDHFAHGSHVNEGVSEILEKDQSYWLKTEEKFQKYWQRRFLLGKGKSYAGEYLDEPGADWKVPDEIYKAEDLAHKLIRPSVNRQFTSYFDCQALIWLAERVSGNYFEIGCHQGLTLMQLAYNYPDRVAYGLDYTGVNEKLNQAQASEQPTVQELGWQVRGFKNVQIFNCLFDQFNLNESLDDVGLVFVDADSTYEGVKAITEKVLAYFMARSKKRRIVAWHDYIPQRLQKPDDADWIKVGHYVRSELADLFVCRFIRDTNLAYMVWNGSPGI